MTHEEYKAIMEYLNQMHEDLKHSFDDLERAVKYNRTERIPSDTALEVKIKEMRESLKKTFDDLEQARKDRRIARILSTTALVISTIAFFL